MAYRRYNRGSSRAAKSYTTRWKPKPKPNPTQFSPKTLECSSNQPGQKSLSSKKIPNTNITNQKKPISSPQTNSRNDPRDKNKEQWIIDNLSEQKDEFESISDIYSTELIVIKKPSSYKLKMTSDENNKHQIILEIKCPIEYPSKSPPNYSISTTFLKHIPNRTEIDHKFKTIWSENEGQCIMFEWISEFQEFASTIFNNQSASNPSPASPPPQSVDELLMEQFLIEQQMIMEQTQSNDIDYSSIPIEEQRNKLSIRPNVMYCDKHIEDRKSIFKSYMSFVCDISGIQGFIDTLKSNKKIAKATHNMIAYRLSSSSSGIINEHYDDDGEHGGGKVILEILRRRHIVDVVVMVSRWYGGILLGSDRFKHIKTMTQYVLEQENVGSNCNYQQHMNSRGGDKRKKDGSKPMGKNIEIGRQILNRLYWTENKGFVAKHVYIGCKCKDKKLHDIIEFNLEEYGVQKNGIDWVEYISYKGLLIWDIWNLCRNFEEVNNTIQNM